MAAWIVITTDDLNDYSVGAKVNALRTAALAAGQSDPFTNVRAAVMATMRAMIASCSTNRLSATANSLPPSLKQYGCWLVIEAMQVRLSGLVLTEDEKEKIKEAKEHMKMVASCDYAVEEPDDPVEADVQSGGAVEIVSQPRRVTTKTTLGGL